MLHPPHVSSLMLAYHTLSHRFFERVFPRFNKGINPLTASMMDEGWYVLYSLHSLQLYFLVSDLLPIPVLCMCRGDFYHLHCGLSCVLGCVYLALFYLIMILFTSYHQKFVKISHLLMSFIMSFQHFISIVMNIFTFVLKRQDGKCRGWSEPKTQISFHYLPSVPMKLN